MPGNTYEVSVDASDTVTAMDRLRESIPDAGEEVVDQLAVLAESHMKREAPEGAGRVQHLRDTIRAEFNTDGMKAVVRPHKRTESGIPLVEILVDGADWDPDNPPPLAPLQEWTGAKWGDPSKSAAAKLRNHLVTEGMDPNPFVQRSIQSWNHQVGRVAGQAVASELGGGL